ncbi:MAG TPA: hypothetical protein VED22_00335 [Nitrososphaerales archaeon]|nr:hypothetical protein [Nitrososphaerales archaeon]
MRRWYVGLVLAVAFTLFFVFVPVVGTHLVPCLIGGGFGYASLSFHFFGVGGTYQYGSYGFLTQGIPLCW